MNFFKKGILFWSIIFICFLGTNESFAQGLTQTVRGTVYDKTTNTTLPGASVQILHTNPVLGNATDKKGTFRIDDVPVGRYDIKVSFVGYKSKVISNVLVNSGHEVVLNIELTQSTVEMKGVVVTPETHGIKPINSMAQVSGREFSVEETQRYAGGLDDPSRLASSFAGVSTGSVSNNAIIVRGNSPKGLLWQVEGVPIPSPNHFEGSTIAGGGYTTIFSNSVLANSDFLIGAFPAEYGNANAGVFDMNLRNGNNQTREYTLKAGIKGLNAGAEGPFSKNGNSSYLFNYRYSTIGLISKTLINADRTPAYQDLSLKLNFPTQKAGTFSLWGVGGLGSVDQKAKKDSTEWEYNEDRQKYDYDFLVGATGLAHRIGLGERSSLSSTLFATINGFKQNSDSLSNNLNFIRNKHISNKDMKIGIKSELTHRFSASFTNKTGFIFQQLFYNVNANLFNSEERKLTEYTDKKGNTTHLQAYTESKIYPSDNLSITAGVHLEYLDISKDLSIEPRFSFKWTFSQTQSIGFAYGLHSQLAPTKIYFTHYHDPESSELKSNRNLGFTKAHHLVLSYQKKLSKNMWLKVEPYIQQLYDVPVVPKSNFSFINYKQEQFFDHHLINKGKGRNIGVDVTLHRAFNNNYYFTFTSSLFKSTYETAAGETFNSRYNKNYVFNILGGKEFILGDDHNRLLGVNARFTLNGGARVTRPLQTESKKQKDVILDKSQPFAKQQSPNFITDLSITYRINKQKYNSIWALQVKNAFAAKSYIEQRYNYQDKRVVPYEISIVIPSISYRIEF